MRMEGRGRGDRDGWESLGGQREGKGKPKGVGKRGGEGKFRGGGLAPPNVFS